MTGFIFGGDTGVSAAQLERQREIARQMMEQGSRPAQSLSEGMTNLANSIFGKIADRRAEREWKQQNEAAWAPIAQSLRGPQTVTEPATGQSAEVAPKPLAPESMMAALGSGYLAPGQQSIVQAMLGRHYQSEDQAQSWQREDSRTAEERAYRDKTRAEDRAWRASQRQPQQRRIVAGPDGNPYYEDGTPVLPNVPPPAAPQPMTAEQKDAWGLPPNAPYVMVNGRPKLLQTPRGPDETNVTVNAGVPPDELLNTLAKEEAKSWSGYLEAGASAAGVAQDMDVLDALAGAVPSGPLQGRLAEMFPEFSDAAGVFSAVVSRIAPRMRATGSGASSDKDVDMFLKSLPRLRYGPDTNRAIVEMFRAKAAIDQERADIVTSAANGEISTQEARNKMRQINGRSVMPPALRKALGSVGVGGQQSDVERALQKYGNQ